MLTDINFIRSCDKIEIQELKTFIPKYFKYQELKYEKLRIVKSQNYPEAARIRDEILLLSKELINEFLKIIETMNDSTISVRSVNPVYGLYKEIFNFTQQPV